MGIITHKSLSPPDYTRRTVRRRIALFSGSDNELSAFALHFRKEGDLLVCAEGEQRVRELPADAKLYRETGHGNHVFSYTNGMVEDLTSGKSHPFSQAPTAIVCFLDKMGAQRHYALCAGGLYELLPGGAVYETSYIGTYAAMHYERLFAVSGCRVRYSKPLVPDNWEQAVQDAGYVDLPSEGGDTVAIVSYKERLYLFREHGITQLRALGDTLNFKAVTMPYACGKILAGSVRTCGENVLFLTESGLYSFGGAACERIDGAGTSFIDLSAPVSAAAYDGKYYCAVCLRDGEKCIFCVDPEQKTGHFIRFAATSVAGGDALYFTEGGHLHRLTDRGLPGDGECVVKCERSLLGLSDAEKFVDHITVEGEGYFQIEVRAEHGPSRFVRGYAGERLRLPFPVRGNTFSLVMRSLCANAKIKAVVLGIREENRTW